MNNPMNAVDPDGRQVWIRTGEFDSTGRSIYVQYANGNLYNSDGSTYSGSSLFALTVQMYIIALLAMNDPLISERVNYLITNEFFNTIQFDLDGDRTSPNSSDGADIGIPQAVNIRLGMQEGIYENGIKKWAIQTLLHEFQHAFDYNTGQMIGESKIISSAKDPAEIRAVQFENRYRKLVTPKNLRVTYKKERILFANGCKFAK